MPDGRYLAPVQRALWQNHANGTEIADQNQTNTTKFCIAFAAT
jgi:hypothetical protein